MGRADREFEMWIRADFRRKVSSPESPEIGRSGNWLGSKKKRLKDVGFENEKGNSFVSKLQHRQAE